MTIKYAFVISLFFILISNQYLSGQSVRVVFPNGGEHWIHNTYAPHNIIWHSSGIGTLKIEFSSDGGIDWATIAGSVTASDSSYSWQVPDIASSQCLIRISDSENSTLNDVNDNFFNITLQEIYYAAWNTSMGMFRCELRGDKAPMTAQNFINLAERNFYHNLIFHRVISGFMIQDGDPLGTGEGGPGYEFADEFSPDLTYDYEGVLGMANAGPNTNGSQYFITVAPYTYGNGIYSVFGRVVDGMNTVYAISNVPRDANDKPLTDITLNVNIVAANPEINFTFPQSGASVFADDTASIKWLSDFVADVKIEFSDDSGSTWSTVKDSIPADKESFLWQIPTVQSSNCILKITDLRNPGFFQSVNFAIRTKPAKFNRFEMFENVNPDASNPENAIQPGNIIHFKVRLKNQLPENLNNLSAVVTSSDTFATILQPNVSFQPSAPGMEVWSDQEISVKLSKSIPTPSDYHFMISASDGEHPDIPWVELFKLPIIQFFSNTLILDDDNTGDSHGNGNHIAEPGETIEFKPRIKNKSSLDCYQVWGQLTAVSNFINVWNNITGYAGLVVDTALYNNFNPILANSNYSFPNHNFVFDYNASDIFKTDFLIKVTGYPSEAQGSSWDAGGIKLRWDVPFSINNTYPSNIPEISKKNTDLNIYPIPSRNSVTIQWSDQFFENSKPTVEIYDIKGKIIENLNSEEKYLPNSVIINTQKLVSGIYFVKVFTDKNSLSEKFLIVK
jgi:peptidyl-prolyl cis-trans isomerase A (cyclophilin A)